MPNFILDFTTKVIAVLFSISSIIGGVNSATTTNFSLVSPKSTTTSPKIIQKNPTDQNIYTRLAENVEPRQADLQKINNDAKKLNSIATPEPSATAGTTAKTNPPPVNILEQKPIINIPHEPILPTTTPTISPQASSTPVDWQSINNQTRLALANILCTADYGSILSSETGSGVIIDKQGVVLTDAHVAQYFLIQNSLPKDFLRCVVRTGNPASVRYDARILYISPTWIKNNFKVITEENPTGTGENDFALLLITGKSDGTSLPSEFPTLEPSFDFGNIKEGNQILVGAYPAELIDESSITRNFFSSSAISNIKKVFTFNQDTPDLIDIGGTVVSQKGSSGGPAVDNQGKVLGIFVTSIEATSTANRDLRAITISHINQSISLDSGKNLSEWLNGDLETEANDFETNQAPALREILLNQIIKK